MLHSSQIPAEALEEALMIAGVGCWSWHPETRELRVSGNFHSLLGCTPEALPQSPAAWLELAHADERPKLARLFELLATNTARGQPAFTLRLRHGDGLWRSFEVRVPGANQGEHATPLVVTFNEIPQQKQAEAALPDVNGKQQAEREPEAHRANLEHLDQERTFALEDGRDTLSKIIDGSPVPTLVLDADHRITHWNKACEQIIGVKADDIVGTSDQWKAFYPSPRPIMADLVITGEMTQIQALYSNKYRRSRLVQGGYEAEDYFPMFDRWLFFTAAPLRDKQGKIVGAIETLQDITERKQAEIALIEAKHAAEAAANAKAAFLANISHEIRTPMNAVIGLAHLLLKGELSGKQRDYISRIHGAGQMLLGLINDILDFSKIEAGRMALEATEFALDDVLENVTGVLLHRAQEKGLTLQYVVEPDVPGGLVGDPLRLAQILINLLGNALKFTASGSVTVFVRRLPGNSERAELEIDVQDTGIGMSPEQQRNLFQAFSQADSSITRQYGGTGLGLTICKRLVELMQGDIWVTSQPGVGSTFTFSVSLGLSKLDAQPPHRTLRRALVVDDSPLARAILIRLLEKHGYTAIAAESGGQALSLLADTRTAPFEFVTIDFNMPGMDGLELAEAIRNQISPCPRLVMVTASDTATLNAEERLHCVDAVLNKPLTAAQIGKLVKDREAQSSNAPNAPAPLAGLRVLLVDDMPTNLLIAGEMLESIGITVDTADNGRLALKKILDNGNKYDIVLMDIQMPEMDGLEATQHLRADARSKNLVVIAMTANALAAERQRCLVAGMNDFLTKPIDPALLQETLFRWRPRQETPAPLKKQETSPMTSADGLPNLPGIDTADGLRRMMNKPSLYEKVLRDFHARFIDEAKAIQTAISAGDFRTAERRAHSTKGLAGTIGATGLQDAARALELALKEDQMAPTSTFDKFAQELSIVIGSIACGFNIDPAN